MKKKKVFDRGGTGTEIVRELLVCPDCAIRLEAEKPAETPEPVAVPEPVEIPAE